MQGVTAAMPPLFWPNLVEHIQFVDGRGGFLSCRPVAAVTATTTTPNSIHKMSETEEEEKMTRFLSTVDSFLSASRRRERAGFVRRASTRLAFC